MGFIPQVGRDTIARQTLRPSQIDIVCCKCRLLIRDAKTWDDHKQNGIAWQAECHDWIQKGFIADADLRAAAGRLMVVSAFSDESVKATAVHKDINEKIKSEADDIFGDSPGAGLRRSAPDIFRDPTRSRAERAAPEGD